MAGMFGGGDAPKPKPAAPMPDDQSPSVLEASRRERERILSRGGRASTILTSGDKAAPGGDSYAGTTLGSGGG